MNNQEGKTCLWPIYVDKETHEIIDTVTNLMKPVDPKMVSLCKQMIDDSKTESDSLKTFMTEMFLTLNSGVIKNNVDFLIIACDKNTKEIIDFVNPSPKVPQNERMKRLIDLLDNACTGVGVNGNANDLMTIIGNVMARYCASDSGCEQSFNELIKFWKEQLNKSNV